MDAARIIRILVIFLIIQSLIGLVYTIRQYNMEKESYPYPYELSQFTGKYNIPVFIFAWQIPFLVESLFGRFFIQGIIVILGSLLFLIWITYIIDKKIFIKRIIRR